LPRTTRSSAVEDTDTDMDTEMVEGATELLAEFVAPPQTPYSPPPHRTIRAHHPAPSQFGGRNTYGALDLIQIAYQNGFLGFDSSTLTIVTVPQVDRKGVLTGQTEPMAIVSVTGVFRESDGTFTRHSGSADASPSNCTVGQAYARMAETRAQGRLIRTAMGMDANATEEFNTEDSVIPRTPTPFRAPAPNGSRNTYVIPEPNSGQASGYECEVCGKELRDSAKYSAGQIASMSVAKTKQILCWDHQQEALGRA
jgi:hypothetical protein